MTDAIFISTMNVEGDGLRLAVKDLIDVAGFTTTAGSRAIASRAEPATKDAACMAGARAVDARVVGKTNLVELAFGTSGINPHFGTPLNPLDPARIPGGSSSGSAVAVAVGAADVAFGSDTGGSIRIPAACCGVVGLKTTFGRVPLEGVRPLAPSFDTVGPMGRTVRDVAVGMALLEEGFHVSSQVPASVGRLRLPAAEWIDTAIDEALERAGFGIVDLELPAWFEALDAARLIIEYEAARSNAALLAWADELDPFVASRLERGAAHDDVAYARAKKVGAHWTSLLEDLVERYEVIALPCLVDAPPLVADGPQVQFAYHSPVNLAGLPALALPASPSVPYASIQLITHRNGEELLLAAGQAIEDAN